MNLIHRHEFRIIETLRTASGPPVILKQCECGARNGIWRINEDVMVVGMMAFGFVMFGLVGVLLLLTVLGVTGVLLDGIQIAVLAGTMPILIVGVPYFVWVAWSEMGSLMSDSLKRLRE